MKTKELQIKDLREIRDKLYNLMQDTVLSDSEKYIIQSAALIICDLIKLEKGEQLWQ